MFTIYWTFVFLVKKVMLQLSRIFCYFQSIIGMLSKHYYDIIEKLSRGGSLGILSVTLQLFFFKECSGKLRIELPTMWKSVFAFIQNTDGHLVLLTKLIKSRLQRQDPKGFTKPNQTCTDCWRFSFSVFIQDLFESTGHN